MSTTKQPAAVPGKKFSLVEVIQQGEWNQQAESTLNDDALNAARAAHSGDDTYASYEAQHPDDKDIEDATPDVVEFDDVEDTLKEKHSSPV